MKLHQASKITYNLRLEGKPWRRGLSRDALFEQIHQAYETLFDSDIDMLFLVEQEFKGGCYDNYFCTPYTMWEALCETPEIMADYLQLSWER
jgi:hypothetical protein